MFLYYRDLVLPTLLDPRFKLMYLDCERHEDYKYWLIAEAEKQFNIEVILMIIRAGINIDTLIIEI